MSMLPVENSSFDGRLNVAKWTVRRKSGSSLRILPSQLLLSSMIALQLLWLAVRWHQRTYPNWQRVPLIMLGTLLVVWLVLLVQRRFGNRASQFFGQRKLDQPWLIAGLCLSVFLLGTFYAFFQVEQTDEANFLNAARIFADVGLVEFLADYKSIPQLGEMHPPLVAFAQGTAAIVASPSLVVLRLVSVSLATATVFVTFLLGRELYDAKTGLLAAIMLLGFRYFVHLGGVANNDIAITFFFTLALYLTVKLCRRERLVTGLFAGLVIGLGLLSKYTMALVYPVAAGVVAINCGRRQWPVRPILLATLTSIALLAMWLVYANHLQVTGQQVSKVGHFAGCVANSPYGRRLFIQTATISLPSAIGVYLLPALIASCLMLLKRRSQSDKLLLCWITVVSLAVFAMLPVSRYFLPMFPALALAIATWIRRNDAIAFPIVALVLSNCALSQSLFLELS